MKKTKIIILLIFFAVQISVLNHLIYAQSAFKEKLSGELSIGPRIPIGITKDDITTGLAIHAGLGYNLFDYFELIHAAIDFGNSSPHNPEMEVIYTAYDYYGTFAMETVSIIGIPISSRFHFPVKKYIDGFVGAGISYYWFSSRFEAQDYYNYTIQLRKPRKRSGYGPLLEGGIITNFFSERILVELKGNVVILETDGKSLSIRDDVELEANNKRQDKYLTISLGIKYLFNN